MRIYGEGKLRGERRSDRDGSVIFQPRTQFSWGKNVYVASMRYVAAPTDTYLRNELLAWVAEGKVEILEDS